MNKQFRIEYQTKNTTGSMVLPSYLYPAIIGKLNQVKGWDRIEVITEGGNIEFFTRDVGRCLAIIPKVVKLDTKVWKILYKLNGCSSTIPQEAQELLYDGIIGNFPILEEYPELKQITDLDILAQKILECLYTGGKK